MNKIHLIEFDGYTVTPLHRQTISYGFCYITSFGNHGNSFPLWKFFNSSVMDFLLFDEIMKQKLEYNTSRNCETFGDIIFFVLA